MGSVVVLMLLCTSVQIVGVSAELRLPMLQPWLGHEAVLEASMDVYTST